jgi:hypothetical protein
MPKKLEEKLRKEAAKKALQGSRRNAYIFGTLKKIAKKAK